MLLAPLGAALGGAKARAQVALPPPPPPPLSTNESPSNPPPNQGGDAHGGHGHGRGNRPAERPSSASSSSTTGSSSSGGASDDDDYSPEKKLSLRLNPLPIFEARISGDAEYMFAPHHAVVGSPQLTFSAHRPDIVAYGFGYAERAGGIGGEVGYHYWIEPRLEGVFLGPSLVLGLTFAGPTFLYYGAAFDVGWQMILGKGFTFDVGGGLLVIDGALTGIVTHVTPRALAGVGWSF